jgi:hypothetical protein
MVLRGEDGSKASVQHACVRACLRGGDEVRCGRNRAGDPIVRLPWQWLWRWRWR